jgi:hypothetical protein
LHRYIETLSLSHETIAATPQKPAVGPQPFYSEYAINPREVLRAEICSIKGRSVVRLSRWKRTAAGNEKRTGCAFEFGAHRCSAVVALLSNIERELGGLPNAAA